MTREDTIRLEDTFQIPTYRKKPIVASRGQGAWLWDEDGTRYLDLYGGHCVALLGHNHPEITKAITRQLGELHFYSNAVYSPVRARASKALASLAPEGLDRVFFCNSGTEANETALKLARKTTGRNVVMAMEGAFHGRTLGGLSATWGAYRTPYEEILAPTAFVPFWEIDPVIDRLNEGDVAAVILEPIQSMAGVSEAPASYFQALREVCSEAGVLLIFDEVQTGVGRTGTFSICERYGMKPDLISLAKSLGNGVPVGAVLVSREIAETVRPGDQGTTFGGGMLAMAAVEATLQVIVQEDLMEKARRLESTVRHLLTHDVWSIRGAGCLLGLDIGFPAAPVVSRLLDRGIIVGGSNDPNVIRLMPPVVTPLDAIEMFAHELRGCLADPPRVA